MERKENVTTIDSKGVKRFIFWGFVIFYGFIMSIRMYFSGFSLQMLIIGILIAAYLTNKYHRYYGELIGELDDMEYIPPGSVKDTKSYKTMKSYLLEE